MNCEDHDHFYVKFIDWGGVTTPEYRMCDTPLGRWVAWRWAQAGLDAYEAFMRELTDLVLSGKET